jgi:hypothetical protein
MRLAEALNAALSEANLPMRGGRPSFQIRGMNDGKWELGSPDIRALSRWDWMANAALSSQNDWRTLMVDGATEHHVGFKKALKAAVKEYPDLAAYIVAFDGPFKSLADILGVEIERDWEKITFYHGTATANWPSIQKHGLKPRGESTPVYGAATGAAPGRADVVYLTTQSNMAAFAARDAARATRSEPLILRIQGLVGGRRMLPDEDSQTYDPWLSMERMGSVAYKGTIPPRLIKKA